MQIYVHISGKNYGPYSIDQLREYVNKGSFKSNSQACYDGKNWVKISDIPGFVKVAEKPKQQTVSTQQKPKKKLLGIKLLIVGFFLALVASLAGLTYYLLSGDEKEEATAPVTSDENLFILSPDQVVDVYDGDTFKIDLPNMHPLFGGDISL